MGGVWRTLTVIAFGASTMVGGLAATAGPAAADGCKYGDDGYRLVSAVSVHGFSTTGQCAAGERRNASASTPMLTGVSASAGGEWRLTADGRATEDTPGSDVPVGPVAHPAPMVGIAQGLVNDVVWTVAADGAVFTYGDAQYFGGMNGRHLDAPIVDIASRPRVQGYWLVASDGGVFAFGSARYFGGLGTIRLSAPIVDLVPTPSGFGYWLVASDGGVFAFGDARFRGSAAGLHLRAPIVGMARNRAGDGYWLLGADGGVFAFGKAKYLGGETPLPAGVPWAGIVSFAK
jgi:hypothetical protein